jgi:hypothetical protein
LGAKSATPGGMIRPYPPLFVFLRVQKKEPAMEIAGLCLPLKPQKERGYVELQQLIILGRLIAQLTNCRICNNTVNQV